MWSTALDWFNKYGNVIQVFFMSQRYVLIGGNPEAVKIFYNEDLFRKVGARFTDLVGTTGVIKAEGDLWSRIRKTCNGAFNSQHFKIFLAPMHACMDNFVQKLNDNLSTPNSLKILKIDDLCTSFTLDVIGKTMFSVDFESVLSDTHPFGRHMQTYLDITHHHNVNFMHRLLHPFSNFTRVQATKYLHSFVDKVVANRTSLRKSKSGDNGAKDLLDLLLDAQDPESGVGLTSEEVLDQTMTFMFAGHETTAHTLAFTLGAIAMHPHVGDRIRQELDEVLGKGKVVEEYEQGAKLPYMTAVIKETLRVYPIVPELHRILAEDTVIGGYTVPKGTRMILGIVALHYNPQVWANPTTFDPERFLQHKDNDIGGYFVHTPFGYGRRICIGQNFAMLELRIALSVLLRRFNFALAPLSFLSVHQAVTLKPSEGLQMTVSLRNE